MPAHLPAPRDPAASPSGRHLGAMFTATVAAMDRPTRRHLADIVSFCHTRRHPVADARPTPVLFYTERDDVIQSTALPHLRLLEAEGPTDHFPVTKAKTPLNDCAPALDEATLVSTMDEETRRQYLLARFYGYGREVIELGYRYLHHLARPDLPLTDTLRQLPVNDYDATRHADEAEDSEEDFSDDEMIYSDDEMIYSDDEMIYSDEEDSFCSHISVSDVTHESQISQPVAQALCPSASVSDTSPAYSPMAPEVGVTFGGR